MRSFAVGHASHPEWREALAQVAAQIESRHADGADARRPTLGLVYFSDHYGAHAQALLAALRQRWPGVSWAGSVGVGIAAGGVEYFDQPALAIMLAELPPESFEVFSGASRPQRVEAFSALVHADPATPDLGELVAEMSERTASGYLFGGLCSSRQSALHVADGVWQGGLSGVVFSSAVALVSRVTQGCQPLGPTRSVTACDRNVVTRLDDRPALACLLADLGLPGLEDARQALPRLRSTLVGLTDARDSALARPGQFGSDTRVRHLIGLDPASAAVAVGDVLQPGMKLAFCERDVSAARRDLVRICSEIRDQVESLAEPTLQATRGQGHEPASRIRGAVYISCAGRGGPHFGGPSAELRIVQHALGDVPLVGFFAAGEIARHHLYGYTGVLTVFVGDA